MKKKLSNSIKFLAIAILALVLIFCILVILPFSQIGFPKKNYDQLLIENVNIVDVKNDTILKNRFVLVSENRITQIADEPILSNSENLKILNGSDKFLIPALWDMHTHLTKRSPNSGYSQFILNGVMHIRDMRGAYNGRDPFASTPSRIRRWNEEVKELNLLGPMVHGTSSFAVEGPHPMFDDSPDFFNCSNEKEAKKLVNYFKQNKIDIIKTYNNIPRDAFFTLMEEANVAGIDVGGHKPVRVSTIEASNAGMKSIEHARFLIWDSFKGAEELRNEENPKSEDNTELRERMLMELDSSLLNANLTALKRNHTWYCPTHLTRKADAYADDKSFRARYDSINPLLKMISFEDLDAVIQEDTTKKGRKIYKDFYLKGLEITKLANEKGVGLLAGSDVPELPGSSLLEELEEFSKAGLSNFDVIKTATLNPAKYYNLESQYGSIDEGKYADFVILSQNPIKDISNIKNVIGIVYQGNYIDETDISFLNQKVYSRNNGIMMSAKLIWDMLVYTTL